MYCVFRLWQINYYHTIFAPTERVFSIAGKIFRPERCRLSDAAFEKIMFIRANFT